MGKGETIHERISILVQHFCKGKNTVFASKIGVNEANIRGYVKNVVPKADVLEKIVRNYDISSSWLLTGEGSMLKSQPNDADKPIKDNQSEAAYIPLTNSKTKDVLYDFSKFSLYNIDASAGLNKLFIDGGEVVGEISIPNAPRCDGAVYVTGDSMYPLLKSGDIIAYRQVHNLESLIYGEIYLLQLENDGDISIVVKYVKRSEKGDDYIKLVSYNKEHDPKDIPLSWIRAVARVTLTIRKFSIT